MIKSDLKKLAIAGISGTLAGKRAAKLFQKIQTASYEISARCNNSPEEISKIIMDKYRATYLTIDEAIDEIRINKTGS